MKTKTDLGPIIAAIASCLLLLQADGATMVWTNGSGGNWNIAGNWSPNQVPTAGDTAAITNAGTYTVTLNASAPVASLTLGGVSGTQTLLIPGPTLSLEAESSVVGGGLLELSGGTLSGSGMLTVSNVLSWTGGAMSGTGRTVIAPGATLTLANNAVVSLITRTLENAGTVLCTGTGNLQGDPQAVVTNCPGGLWEVRNDQTFTWIGGSPPRFDNVGTFRKSQSTGTATFSQFTFANYGTVEVQSGTLRFLAAFDQTGTTRTANGTVLRLAGGGTASGPFDVALGGLVDWTANYTLNPGAQLNGEGLYQVSSGALTASTNADVAVRNLNLADTLAVNGTLTVSNVLNWTGGAMSGTGQTVIAPGATLNLANNAVVSLSTRTLENAGTVLCTGTGNLQGGPQTVLTNRPGGLWEVRNDQTFSWIGGSPPRFDNAGIFRKSQGTGTTTFSQFSFNNYGDLSVWQGNLYFTTTLNLHPTGRIEFSLGGPDYPSGYGRVTTSPTLQLDGCLVVTFRNGYLPEAGQHYDIISGPNQGTFQCYSAPTISPYVYINPAYQPNLGQLVTTDPTPTVSKLKFDAQNRFTMEIKGIASQNYMVIASTNLQEWIPLQTNTMPAATLWNFVDEGSATLPLRFYRTEFLP